MLEQEWDKLISTNYVLTHQVEQKSGKLHKMLGGSKKLSSMLIMQNSPHCKLSLGGAM